MATQYKWLRHEIAQTPDEYREEQEAHQIQQAKLQAQADAAQLAASQAQSQPVSQMNLGAQPFDHNQQQHEDSNDFIQKGDQKMDDGFQDVTDQLKKSKRNRSKVKPFE